MAEKPNDIEAIYNAALKKRSEAERSAYLDAVCGDDAVLRARVESLVKSHEEAGDFLEVPAVGPDVTVEESPSIEGPGTKIGRYELLELIGEGGMGLVYLAEQQEPLRRRVALKIVKLGMDTKQVIARFEAERQALALLDHTNIAHVFDAGTTKAGRPYFVMEYVEGVSITKYCDEQKLNIEERLELFKQVCEGVQHAHQKGIIHRDIKPSNILVSNHGDKAVPKIIDFGIAKAITQPLTEETFFTHEGQLLGTPEYMSPEQVDLATQDIDTRSDIYSLGVLLYVLLAGVLPFDRESLEHAGFAEIQRTIREDEPPLPSTRLTNLGKEAKVIAENRRTQIITLTRRLHRELEWIPMKAMRKDRTRRYRSASELADDIQNYLTGTPLIAGPESTIYRARKFVRKHAGSVATAALVAVIIVLGLVASTALSFRAENARKQEATARTQAEQAEKVADKQRELAEKQRELAEEQRKLAEEQRKIAEEQAEELRRALYVNSIQLASVDAKYYGGGTLYRARDLLRSCPEDLRGWEWDRLNHILDESVRTLRGDSIVPMSLALSPNGRDLAYGTYDRTVKICSTATGAEKITLRGHKGYVYAVAFRPDGKQIVSGSTDNMIKLWDARTGAELATLTGHQGSVFSVSFDSNGHRIVSGSSDGTIRMWDAKNGTELFTMSGHQGTVGCVAFSPDGKLVVSSGGWDKTIKIWDAASGAEVVNLAGDSKWVWPVVLSPDSRYIAFGGMDKAVKIWDVASGVEKSVMKGHIAAINSIGFTPEGKRVISASADGTIKVWDTATGNEITTLRGHANGVGSIKLSPAGKEIYSAGYDKMIKVWNPAIDRKLLMLTEYFPHSRMIFSPDSKRIAAAVSRRVIVLWDVSSGAEVMSLKGDRDGIRSIAFSPDGRQIASGYGDNTIEIWDIASGVKTMTLTGHNAPVFSLAFSPDGRRMVSGSDKEIKVWDATSGGELVSFSGHDSRITALACSPDGKHIASCDFGGTIKVWEAGTGTESMVLKGGESAITSIAFSPDGKRIVSCGHYSAVKIWDAANGNELMRLDEHTGTITSAAFSPDGKRIVSYGNEPAVKIWDANNGRELMHFYWPGKIYSAAFSPDGRTVGACSQYGIVLWESGTPAAGYGPRQNAKDARKVVDKLYEKHGLYSEVIDKMKTDETIDESVRKLALQIANARLWEDKEKSQKADK